MSDDERARQRERDVGQGYPEEQPTGTGIDAHEHPEDDIDAGDAPPAARPEDSDPSTATGNPKAAGS